MSIYHLLRLVPRHLCLPLVVSILIHLSLVGPTESPNTPHPIKVSEPIRLTFTHTPINTRPPLSRPDSRWTKPREKKATHKTSKTGDTRALEHTSTVVTNQTQRENFLKHWLPKPSELSYSEQGEPSTHFPLHEGTSPLDPLNGDPRTVPLDFQQIDDLFDIPLRLRKVLKHQTGIVRLAVEEGRLILISLTGHPYLRACLFRGLKNSRSMELLKQIMTAESLSREIVIELRTNVVPRGNSADRYQNMIFWQKPKLILLRTLNEDASFGPQPTGAEIDDEYAQKARRRDSVTVRELEQMPGFLKTLRNYVLN